MESNKLQHKLSVVSFLQKFALQQIDLALDYVTNPVHKADLAIHETRRCLKRLRAILRLVRAEVGETVYDRDNTYFCNLGRQLSELRDATVTKKTLGSLQKQFPQTLTSDTWRIIKKGLTGSSRTQSKKILIRTIATKLKIAGVRVRNWPLELDDQAALQKAVQLTYRKGRRAMEVALQEPQPENFHEWRKQVNYLRHQLQILQELKVEFRKVTLQEVKKLAQILGVMNDLAVLSLNLSAITSAPMKTELQRLQQLIQSSQEIYHTEAIAVGKALYHLPARLLTTSMIL